MTPPRQRIAVVLVAALLLLSLGSSATHRNVAPQQPLTELPVEAPAPVTPHMAAVLAASKGFSVAVSYTDEGFEPASVTLLRGETIRFTNNSDKPLVIRSVGAPQYPGRSSCGQSAFDSCIELPKNDFWEFTFDARGTWGYRNAQNPMDGGEIRVR